MQFRPFAFLITTSLALFALGHLGLPTQAVATSDRGSAPALRDTPPPPVLKGAEHLYDAPGGLASIPPLNTHPGPCTLRVSAGRSDALRALSALPGQPLDTHISTCPGALVWHPVDPNEGQKPVTAGSPIVAPSTPGAYRLGPTGGPAEGGPLLFVLHPFQEKSGTTIEDYRLGYWPGERGDKSGYSLPVGFIKVTEAVAELSVSKRLKVGQFLTKNQHSTWPKYLLLDLRLVDKLELIAAQMRSEGLPGNRLFIMSGFRTPEYNAPGVGKGGRASNSRHLYGDAADMWVDDDGNGRLDDLNGDGVVDTRDVHVMLRVQSEVESHYPELAGGGGVYKANAAHGPFLHVDVRGRIARWGAL